MPRILPILGLALALRCGAFAQTSPPQPVLTLTLQDALHRARANGQQLLSADIAARIAREDRVQAKAALLPSVNWQNGFVYTQPNGTDTGVFVANNGPRVYTNMAAVHADIFAPGKRADYQMAIAAEAIARAKVEIASRGLAAVVVQNFYAMAVAAAPLSPTRSAASRRRSSSWTSRRSRKPAARRRTPTWSRRSSRSSQRQRDVQEAQLAYDKARIGFAVFLFPDFRQDFTVVDDLDSLARWPRFPKSRPWRATTIRRSAPRRPPSRRRPTASRARAPACCPPSRWTTSSASRPTSTRCTMNSARTTSAAPWWPASTFRSGTGARRAARSGRPN